MAKTKKYAFGGMLKPAVRSAAKAVKSAPKPAAPKPYIPPKLPGVRAGRPGITPKPALPFMSDAIRNRTITGFKPMPPGVVPRAPEQGPGNTAFSNTIASPALGVGSKGIVLQKKGGVVKSSASKRGDGIATKGKTKGKMV